MKALSKAEIQRVVIDAAKAIAAEHDVPVEHIDADSQFFGAQGLFHSLALVHLVIEVEQLMESRLKAAVTLTDERAMSQLHSPFRSCASLTAYIHDSLLSVVANG